MAKDTKKDKPTAVDAAPAAPQVAVCEACNGDGVKNPTDTFVCPACNGTGKA